MEMVQRRRRLLPPASRRSRRVGGKHGLERHRRTLRRRHLGWYRRPLGQIVGTAAWQPADHAPADHAPAAPAPAAPAPEVLNPWIVVAPVPEPAPRRAAKARFPLKGLVLLIALSFPAHFLWAAMHHPRPAGVCVQHVHLARS